MFKKKQEDGYLATESRYKVLVAKRDTYLQDQKQFKALDRLVDNYKALVDKHLKSDESIKKVLAKEIKDNPSIKGNAELLKNMALNKITGKLLNSKDYQRLDNENKERFRQALGKDNNNVEKTKKNLDDARMEMKKEKLFSYQVDREVFPLGFRQKAMTEKNAKRVKDFGLATVRGTIQMGKDAKAAVKKKYEATKEGIKREYKAAKDEIKREYRVVKDTASEQTKRAGRLADNTFRQPVANKIRGVSRAYTAFNSALKAAREGYNQTYETKKKDEGQVKSRYNEKYGSKLDADAQKKDVAALAVKVAANSKTEIPNATELKKWIESKVKKTVLSQEKLDKKSDSFETKSKYAERKIELLDRLHSQLDKIEKNTKLSPVKKDERAKAALVQYNDARVYERKNLSTSIAKTAPTESREKDIKNKVISNIIANAKKETKKEQQQVRKEKQEAKKAEKLATKQQKQEKKSRPSLQSGKATRGFGI